MAQVKKRAPTLYLIIAIKLGKGLLLLAAAAGIYRLADDNIAQEFKGLLKFIHLDPQRKFWLDVAHKFDAVTPANVYAVALGTALYSLFSLVEGVGLTFRVNWAGWMAIGESMFFIPIEIYELMHGYSTTVLIIMILNITIVWYLLQNRHRLFRHHLLHDDQASVLTPAASKANGGDLTPDI